MGEFNLLTEPLYENTILTPNEEVAADDEHQADGGQHKPSSVSVVLIADKTDPAHGVSVHLWFYGKITYRQPLLQPRECQTVRGERLPSHLGDSQDGHGEDEGDGPGDHVEVGGPARQRLLRGAQGFEGRVPGVGQHHKPNHARHQGVVHDDEDGDARQRL